MPNVNSSNTGYLERLERFESTNIEALVSEYGNEILEEVVDDGYQATGYVASMCVVVDSSSVAVEGKPIKELTPYILSTRPVLRDQGE